MFALTEAAASSRALSRAAERSRPAACLSSAAPIVSGPSGNRLLSVHGAPDGFLKREIVRSAQKDIRRLDRSVRVRVIDAIELLVADPYRQRSLAI